VETSSVMLESNVMAVLHVQPIVHVNLVFKQLLPPVLAV